MSDILEKIVKFKKKEVLELKQNNNSNNLKHLALKKDKPRGFLKKLYSVYLTYVPKKKLKNKLIIHKDKRGKFIELLKNNSNGQISFLTVNPKKERGNHFHITKVERFYPLKGKGKIVFKKIDENKINVINFNANYPEVIETIPGTAHKIVNTSSNEIFMLIWSNEIYSPKKPDTHKYKI